MVLIPSLAVGAGYVGQVTTGGARVDGVAAPIGTTIFPGSVIETTDAAAVVQLAGGRLLQMAGSSTAVITREAESIRVAVLSGAVGYLEGPDSGIALDAGDEAELSEGGLGEGEAVPAGDPDERVAICVLQDATPERIQLCNVEEPDNREDCEWYRKRVERRDLVGYLARGAVYADKDQRTEGMNPEVVCGRAIAPWIWGGGAGAAAALLLGNDSTNPAPVSPIVP